MKILWEANAFFFWGGGESRLGYPLQQKAKFHHSSISASNGAWGLWQNMDQLAGGNSGLKPLGVIDVFLEVHSDDILSVLTRNFKAVVRLSSRDDSIYC